MTDAKTEERYNGWTNYETWAVSLWLTNDQGLCDYATELTAGGGDFTAAERLKEWLSDAIPEPGLQASEIDGLWRDLLTAALSKVNWLEIARAFRGEENSDAQS